MIGLHARKIAAKGLELIQTLRTGVEAVRAAANLQILVHGRESQLCLIAASASRRRLHMTSLTLQSGRRRREAPVQITLLCRELAQRAH
jgi:hypothetical protein